MTCDLYVHTRLRYDASEWRGWGAWARRSSHRTNEANVTQCAIGLVLKHCSTFYTAQASITRQYTRDETHEPAAQHYPTAHLTSSPTAKYSSTARFLVITSRTSHCTKPLVAPGSRVALVLPRSRLTPADSVCPTMMACGTTGSLLLLLLASSGWWTPRNCIWCHIIQYIRVECRRRRMKGHWTG